MLSLVFMLLPLTVPLSAQDDAGGFTYGELKTGYSLTQFGEGLSERFDAGGFSSSGGAISSIAAYRKFSTLRHLHFGIKFKGMGSGPAVGSGGEEMFFNFWGASVSVKYFPFNDLGRKGVFLLGDFNFATQFTQKYRNVAALEFDHQFAIGNSLTLGVGYHLPLGNRFGLIGSVEYDIASREGEVEGVGDRTFRNTNLAVQVGLLF